MNHRSLHRHRRLRHEPLEDRMLLSVGGWIGPGATDELVQTFHNPDPDAGDSFGVRAAVVGTDTIVIGDTIGDAGVENAGTVYMFDLTSGELLHTIHNPDPSGEDHFGCDITAAGDQHVLIGAWRTEVGGLAEAGAVYLFNLQGELVQTITSPTPGEGHECGYSCE